MTTSFNVIEKISRSAARRPLLADEALQLVNHDDPQSFQVLLEGADRLRRLYREKVSLCAIVNAKSGRCGEDCRFCAQSGHYQTGVDRFGLIDVEAMLTAASAAKKMGACRFSTVVSGRRLPPEELAIIGEFASELIEKTGLAPCASLGILDESELGPLKKAGLKRYHHNMEASRSFYPSICTTRTYNENREAVLAAKRAGLSVCSGGLFGMGESWEQRVELLMDLRDMAVDSVPINFLHPIAGTPLEHADGLTPKDCLRIIALARHILPDKGVIVCGGREWNVRELQPMIFKAGASGMMVGNYLSTKGRKPEDDLRMIADQGIEAAQFE